MKIKLVNTYINQDYIDTLSEIIFNNFKEIAHIKELGHNIESIKELLKNKTLLLFDGEILIGYMVSEVKNVGGRYIYYISYIYVATEYRSCNLGSVLINYAIHYCKNNDIKFITLTFDTSNEKLVNFYVKKGFKQDQYITTNFNNNKVFTLFI